MQELQFLAAHQKFWKPRSATGFEVEAVLGAHPVPVEPTADSTSRLAASELRNALLVPYAPEWPVRVWGETHVLWSWKQFARVRARGGVGVCPILGEADWVCSLRSGPLALKCLLGCFSMVVKVEALWQSCCVRPGYNGCDSRCFRDLVFLGPFSHMIPTVGQVLLWFPFSRWKIWGADSAKDL